MLTFKQLCKQSYNQLYLLQVTHINLLLLHMITAQQ